MMEESKKQELNQSLVDVRKAYRLLYHYQRRVIDLAYFIGNSLKLKPVSGNPWFSEATFNRTSARQGRWAWDWLGMYYYNFYFENVLNDDRKVQFGVIIQSDTGYFDSEKSKKLNLNDFNSPEQAETRIILAASQGNWDSKAIRETKFFKTDIVEYLPLCDNNDWSEAKIFAKAYPLSEFIDEQSSLEIINGFKEVCAQHNIVLMDIGGEEED